MKLNQLSILIKPASSQCNMRCDYCFYFAIADQRQEVSKGLMTQETVSRIIDECFFVTNSTATIHFSFQGGEPTLAGIEFFKNFVDEVHIKKEYRTIHYSLQTNGTIINDEWVSFFKQEDFLIGISIDGYSSNHDHYRKLSDRVTPTYSLVLSNYQKLRKSDVRVNVLTVLTNSLAMNPYRFFKWLLANKITHVQIIPCLNGLKPQVYQHFFNTLFDLYKEHLESDKLIHISLFDNLFMMLNNQYPSQCGMLGNCAMQSVIEANGDIYPCDFYTDDFHCLGNIHTESLGSIFKKESLKQFIKKEPLSEPCSSCEVLKMCFGNCKALKTTFIDKSYCGYREFLLTNMKDIISISKEIREWI